MIIPVYKPLGASSHQLAAAIGRQREEKATHTGTLDPLAEGVLVVVTGEDRFRKAELAATTKEYLFSLLVGVSTDSHDLLGLHTSSLALDLPPLELLTKKIEEILPKYTGTQLQLQPMFSAARREGESLFDHAKKQSTHHIPPTNQVVIDALELIHVTEVPFDELQTQVLERIATVTTGTGEFRQEEVTAGWNAFFKTAKSEGVTHLAVATLAATVSKRTYIRALVRDFSAELGVPATTFSIVRTRNGPYSSADCVWPGNEG